MPKKEGETMPLVHIDLLAGRSEDQLHQLVKDVTAAIVKNTGAPAEHVHIVLNEMANNRYSVGGVMKDEDQ
ncbi:2-hydroxymuconate tautomerase [Schleiferilactobacillus harbinensis]|uniref:4-oxalocrotonate tautomerase n=1 Tax=Schleiferilactobacillus harbinensis TaxID=304207 RepID=A0ABU7T2I7_9LACO|nr:2-hydroxymuconate tautomerase [Schleiferilactobacillus harbinensis]